MNQEQMAVRDFNERAGAEVNYWPEIPPEDARRLRECLIEEELKELRAAGDAGDILRVADALADLLYVVYGGGDTYGLDLEPLFWEVHASNLSKAQVCPNCDGTGWIGSLRSGEGGHACYDCDTSGRVFVKRKDGKILKGGHYREPDLAPIVQAQECRP